MGFCTSSFAKHMNKKVLIYTGYVSAFLGILSWRNYISINWRRIDKEIFHLMTKELLLGCF